MEPKKNPKYDIHRWRGIIFNFNFALSLLLVITAFRWNVKTEKKIVCPSFNRVAHVEFDAIPIVLEKKKPVSAPAPTTPPTARPRLESINFKAVDDDQKVEEPIAPVDQSSSPMIEIPLSGIDVPEEIVMTEFRVVEKMPEPVGGWATFFKTLQKHIKYPKQAERAQVSGKVFVEFTVNETGGLERISILKGIGFGCDEEAQRVIALTKWNAGKQRGRPVKVRLVQPVTFSINIP